ncbi:hypothetical protein [Pontibacillus marinus]|uniref:Uncharacterized protein n=1 Tax=Pontibacillus marinus BH030004 = DSM 16465 TaxID=1385511 RepID=A0A0A5G219_9BACI|nr:hypothetical protein [Pontibacillus marinus]KGX87146.1 hypothetical protein N783_10490 [Pontibacillus marinus BH030004 = DSM 16465]
MEVIIVNVVFVILVVTLIGFIIYRDHKSNKQNPSTNHKGKSKSDVNQDKEHAEKLTEAQKGNGRAW